MGYQVKNADLQDVAPGTVLVTKLGSGYYLVQIGRARYTKRLNLSVDEATKLIRQLAEQLGEDRP